MRNLSSAIALLATVVFLSGCGVIEGLSKNCQGSDIEDSCNIILGERDNEQDADLATVDGRVTYLEQQLNVLKKQINDNRVTLNSLESSGSADAAVLSALGAAVTAQTVQAANLELRTANLEAQDTIVDYVTFCGPAQPGVYQEIGMRTKSGKIVAYFQSGADNRLVTLVPNTLYQSTDSQHCSFSVTPNGTVVR